MTRHWRSILLVAISFQGMAVLSAVAQTEIIQPDQCLVKFTVPETAKITLQGRDYGSQRELTYRDLDPERIYFAEVLIRYADGETESREIIIRGGTMVNVAGTHGERPELIIQTGHSAGVTQVAFGKDDKTVFTGSTDGSVIVWDTETGRQLRRLGGGGKGVNSIAVSTDGRRAYSGTDDSVSLWDLRTGYRIHHFDQNFQSGKFAVHPDGRQAVSLVFGGGILWDTAAGLSIHTFDGTDRESACAFSTDGSRLAIAGTLFVDVAAYQRHKETKFDSYQERSAAEDKLETAPGIIVWDSVSRRRIATLRTDPDDRIVDIGFSPNGRRLVSVTSRNKVDVWNLERTRQHHSFEHPQFDSNFDFGPLAISPDANYILLGSQKDVALLFELESGEYVREFTGHTGDVDSVAFDSTGRRILTGSDDRTAVLWDVETGERLRTFQGLSGRNLASHITADGIQSVLVDATESVSIWAPLESSQPLTKLDGVVGTADKAQFTRNGERLLTATSDETAQVWETRSGQQTNLIGGLGEKGVVFLGSERRILCVGEHRASIIDTQTGARQAQQRFDRPIRSYVLNKERTVAAFVVGDYQADAEIRLCDAASLQFLASINGPSRYVSTIAFRPGTSQIYLRLTDADKNNRSALYDTQTGVMVRKLTHSNGEPALGAFTPDGRRLIASAKDTLGLEVIDVNSGETIRSFGESAGKLGSVLIGNSAERCVTRTTLDDDAGTEFIIWNVAAGAKLHAHRYSSAVNASISPNGNYLAVWMRDDEEHRIELIDLETGHIRHTLVGTRLAIRRVQVFPDAHSIVAHAEEFRNAGELLIWSTNTGRLQRRISLNSSVSFGVNFDLSHDASRIVASTTADKRVGIWEVQNGRRIDFPQLTHKIDRMGISDDGHRIVLHGGEANSSVDYKNRVYQTTVWNAESGEMLGSIPDAPERFDSIAFSSDGKQLLTGSDAVSPPYKRLLNGGEIDPSGKEAFIWDIASGRPLQSFAAPSFVFKGSSFSHSGDEVAVGGWIRYSAKTGAELSRAQGHSGPLAAVAFGPRDRYAVVGGFDGSVIIWDSQTGRQIRRLAGHSKQVWDVDISPDGKEVLSCGADGRAVLWAFATGARIREFHTSANIVMSAAFSRDGSSVLTAGTDRRAVLWNRQNGRQVREFVGHEKPVADARFSPDGRYIATASGDNTAKLWDAATGRLIRTFRGHADVVFSIDISPDGRRLLTGSADKTAIVWDLSSGNKLHTLRYHSVDVTCVRFSPSGKDVLTCSYDNFSMLWNVETGARIRTFGHMRQVMGWGGYATPRSAEFSRDGTRIIAACVNSAAYIWDAETGEELVRLSGPPEPRSLAGSPDDKLVLVGTAEGAKIYEASTGKLLKDFAGSKAEVSSSFRTGRISPDAFAPDSQRFITFSNEAIRLWDVATGDELVRIIRLSSDDDWLAVTPEGLFDGSEGGRNKVMFRVGDALNVVPVDRFFQDFYYPGLLDAIWRGERPLPISGFADQKAPVVRVLSPKSGDTVDSPTQTIEVEVVDQGGGVKGPWLRQNGARILSPGSNRREGQTVRRSFSLSLVEGLNEIEIGAASEDGSWESEPVALTLNLEKPQSKPSLYLLAIGVSEYDDETMNLSYAKSDAVAMADLFETRAPQLYGNEKVHITRVVDIQATRSGIETAINAIGKLANPQDTAIVFLAGHGITLGQRYFFIPHEFARNSDTFEQDVRDQGLAIDALGDMLSRVPALKRIVIFDTCQSGGALPLNRTSRNPFAFRGALERLSRSQGIFTIAAAAASQDAKEIDQLQHGILTYALLAGIGAVDSGPLTGRSLKPAADSNVVSVREWFSYAQDNVPLLTRLYFGSEQFVGFSGQGQSFPLLPIQIQSE